MFECMEMMQVPTDCNIATHQVVDGELEVQVTEASRVAVQGEEADQQRERLRDDPPGELAATVSDTTAAGEAEVTSTAEGETTALEGALAAAKREGEHQTVQPPELQNQPQHVQGEFVNQGYLLWETSRTNWLRQPKSDTEASASSSQTPRAAAIPVEVDDIIDVIFSPRWASHTGDESPPERFPQNVPLPQMVDILVDLWEAEGLDL